jgi:hypothetical protein
MNYTRRKARSVYGLDQGLYNLIIVVTFPVGAKYLSVCEMVQSCSGAQSDPWTVGTEVCFSAVNRPGNKADHSPQSSVEVKNK